MDRQEYDVEFIVADNNIHQTKERFIVRDNASEKEIWMQDYQEIYKKSGLYEFLFCDLLKSKSHKLIPKLLIDEIKRYGELESHLKVVDFGAGVGLVGECLKKHGVNHIIGVDIFKEAKEATHRDRPNIYHDYYVDDLSNPSNSTLQALQKEKLNCLICVSSLNVIPTKAWSNVFNQIENGGWICLNIVENALAQQPNERSKTGSNELIRQLIRSNILDIKIQEPYQHRISSSGKSISYIAVIAKKLSGIPEELHKKCSQPTWT